MFGAILRGQLRPALVLTLLLCALTGVAYPALVTGLAQGLFPRQANGSLVRDAGGRVVGSALIGQPFARPEYLHPRPSAAGAGYDAAASGGRNKGPTDRMLADTLVAQAVDAAVRDEGAVRGGVPSDLATASASGLDPHLSPASARLQAAGAHTPDTLAAADSASPARQPAAPDTSFRVTFGGFVDSYVAWDAGRPRTLDRAFTTTAARHAEFNVNLAHLEANVSAPRVRGRFAAQFGTSVQANYAGEPRVGTLSGPDVSRYIQEAYLGYQLRPGLWVDGGVFFAPFGQDI